MGVFTRQRPAGDPLAAAALAEARAAELRAQVEQARALAELRREQQAADLDAVQARQEAVEQARRRRVAVRDGERDVRRQRRAAAGARVLARVRLLAPLLIVNTAAVYGQLDYAYREIAPPRWNTVSSLALAVMFALAVESVALYVGWHAHDALLAKAYSTAGRLRRASYTIAGIVAAINYAHFAGEHLAPSAAAVAFGLLSLLSPWLWGLHTRRVQHVQLVREDLVDETGAEFDPARRRAFPIRSWAARRWSIDHNVRDPRAAWAGYNAERRARQTRRAGVPAGRWPAAWAVLRGRAVVTVPASPRPASPAGVPAGPAGEPADRLAARPAQAGSGLRVTPRSLTSAEKVAAAHRTHPRAPHARIAELAGVSVATVKRYRPAGSPSAAVPAQTPGRVPVPGGPVNGTPPDLSRGEGT